jgi:hypothetical protein
VADPRPVGIRIQRPYASEDEFLRGDGLTFGRVGMILPGAPARPPGIVIRFEIVLSDGTAVFRGEGRVVAHRMHASGRTGLEIRFTRLDSHSRELLDKALELRRSGALVPVGASIAAPPEMTPSPSPVRVSPEGQMVVGSPQIRDAEAGGQEATQPEPDMPTLRTAVSLDGTGDDEPTRIAKLRDVRQSDDVLGEATVAVAAAPPREPQSSPAAVRVEHSEPLLRLKPSEPQAVVPVPIPRSIRDDDRTPFAPPVFASEPGEAHPQAPDPFLPRPGSASSAALHSSSPALDKLRSRQAQVSRPSSRDALLDRLRSRRKY